MLQTTSGPQTIPTVMLPMGCFAAWVANRSRTSSMTGWSWANRDLSKHIDDAPRAPAGAAIVTKKARYNAAANLMLFSYKYHAPCQNIWDIVCGATVAPRGSPCIPRLHGSWHGKYGHGRL